MRLIALVLLLQSCAAVPYTTTVDKGQEYELADHGTVEWFIVDRDKSPCLDTRSYGCMYKSGSKHMIWIHRDHRGSINSNEALKHIAEHEFEHIVYGPRHVKE